MQQAGHSEIREERRAITAVFADLAGSTALAEELDSAEVKLIVGEAVARMVAEVERLGGYVKDLAGDGLLAFFGAPVAAIPLLYVCNVLVVKPSVHGWWEYGKTWSSFADLIVDEHPRAAATPAGSDG